MPACNKTGLLWNIPFWLLMTGESVSAIGDTFQLVALSILLYNLTGSGLSAAFGVVCTPITSMLLSTVAGSLGDRFSEKYMLIILDLLRGFIITFLIGSSSIVEIYMVLILHAALGILYGPPYKKLVVDVLNKKDIVKGNSLMTGISGFVYIIGPVAASALINKYGIDIAFYINSLSFVFSAVLIIFIKAPGKKRIYFGGSYKHFSGILDDMKEGFYYCFREGGIRYFIILGTVVCLGTASVNVAFYPYAFNILKVSHEEWGLMLSVFYGTNLLAMFLAVFLERLFKGRILQPLYIMFLLASAVWFLYGISRSLWFVILLQSIEGTLLAICGIFLGSFLQVSSKKSHIARVMGVNDILNNLGKLIGIGAAYILIGMGFNRFVFTVNSIVLFFVTILMSIKYISNKAYRTEGKMGA